MERLIILLIWILISAFVKGGNKKGNRKYTIQQRTSKQKGKSILTTFIEEIEKEKQRSVQSTGSVGPVHTAEKPIISDPPKPKEQPKPELVETDTVGREEEIKEIKDANEVYIPIGSKDNNLNVDLKREVLKGIIYSEILSEPKGLRYMKRRG